MNVSIQASEYVLDEVVRHRAWCTDLLDLQGDGIGFVDAYPDGQNRVAVRVLENHNGSICDRIHQQTANSHFDFHRDSSNHRLIRYSPLRVKSEQPVTR